MAFGGPRSSCVRPGAHSARRQDSRKDLTPRRMALHFVSSGAHAPHSDETLGPTVTRGSSHSARRLRSLAFLCSSNAIVQTPAFLAALLHLVWVAPFFLSRRITLSRHTRALFFACRLGPVGETGWSVARPSVGQEDFSAVTSVGLDEAALRRGHNYISLFHDLDAQRVLYACEGRKAQVVA